MRTAGTLALAFFLSLFVAGMIQIQLGIWFRADLEFVMAILIFVVATSATTIMLGVASVVGASVKRVACWVAAIMLLVCAGVGLWSATVQGFAKAKMTDLPILVEVLVPSLIMVAIQWWLIRRRSERIARDSVADAAH